MNPDTQADIQAVNILERLALDSGTSPEAYGILVDAAYHLKKIIFTKGY